MSYVDTWRSHLKAHISLFAPLAKDRPTVDRIHSLIGAAVLWGIRERREDQLDALRTACGGDPHYVLLVDAMDGWKKHTPLQALEELDREQRTNDALRAALYALLSFFRICCMKRSWRLPMT